MTARSETVRLLAWRWPKVLEWGYLAVILLALATNGANSVLPLAVCLWLAGGICIVALLAFGPPDRTRAPFMVGVCLFLAFTLWIGVQLLPVPEGLASPAWSDLSEFGIQGQGSMSMAPAQGRIGWLWLAFPFLVFQAGLLVLRREERAVAAFRTASVLAGVLAVLCLLLFVVAPDRLLFVEKPSFGDSYTFVFVNRNTAATCLGLILLMLLVNVREEWRALDHTRLFAWIMNGVTLPKSVRLKPFALQVGLLFAVTACLALTKSRAGIGATAIAVALTLALLSWHGGGGAGAPGFSGRRRSLRRKLSQAGVQVLVVLAAIGLLAPRAILRGEVQGTDDARFCIMEGLLAAARDNWLTGGGFGAFPFIFNPYRDPACGIRSVWDKAHNSYIEGVITLGILFVPLVLAGILGLFLAYRTGLRERKSMVAYPVVGLGGLCLVVLHAAFDFSLQIPGMAAFYALFAALTVTISLGRRRMGAGDAGSTGPLPGRGVPGSSALLGLVALSIVVSAGSARDALSIRAVRVFSQAIDAGRPVGTAALHTVVADRLPAGRQDTCDASVLRTSLTVLLADLDRIDRDQAYELWSESIERAEEQVLYALACLPGDGNLWLRLAMLRQAGGEVPREQASLMALAQQLDPSQQLQLVGRLAHWNRLSYATIALSRSEAAADVRNGLNYLPVADIRLVLSTPSPAMADVIREVLPFISPERRLLLEKGGFDWMVAQARKGARRLILSMN